MAEANYDIKSISSNINNLSEEEMVKYFDDIIKNKTMVRDMFLVNVEAYESKIKENNNKGLEIQEQITMERLKHENEVKSLKDLMRKNDEELKKHLINLKLLSKTKEHYEILIKDKSKEIHAIKQKNTFINQDIVNRKLQLNSLAAQIEEAEFQNKNLKNNVQNKLEELNISRYDEQKINGEKCLTIIEEEVEKHGNSNDSSNKKANNDNKNSKDSCKSNNEVNDMLSYKPPNIALSNKYQSLTENDEVLSEREIKDKEDTLNSKGEKFLETKNFDCMSNFNQRVYNSQVFEMENGTSKSFTEKLKAKKCIIF